TGIGGVIRDTLGTGLGARPILNTDVFCFAPLDTAEEDLPAGTLHPRRLLRGVVSGVRDYGNRMGIPTANGAIHFHPDFAGNPLVFCGSVGLIRKEHVDKEVKPGDCIVAIGGRTGRDGIHGATFSSRELTEESEVVSSGAVQIGNPIEEKKVLDAILRLRDENLCRAVTDCGAGGFSSAVGEMGEETGADVYLERAPLKYDGLGPTEVWISEAQERMVMAVDPAKMDRLREILAEEEVECAVLGEFRGDGKLRLHHNGELMGEMDVHFLHEGRPDYERVSEVPTVPAEVPVNPHGVNVADLLPILLADGNVASKEAVIRQYDHEVQGRMTLRPLAGADRDAPMDGCALDPLRNGAHQVVVANGLAIAVD
ncbi:MAG: AIR synthase-related protein, partial [Planctomycetota bacterium]